MDNLSHRNPLEVIGVSLSFWNPRGKSNNEFKDLIDHTFPGKLLNAKVRRDIHVSEASIHGKSIFEVSPKSRAAEDYKSLSKELLNRM
jgi:chromosome partitioning protein